jgi:hypothetical protein
MTGLMALLENPKVRFPQLETACTAPLPTLTAFVPPPMQRGASSEPLGVGDLFTGGGPCARIDA